MRLVLFGSGAFALPSFDHLARAHDVALVVTQPDRPAGRGRALTPTPVGQWAADSPSPLPLLKPQDVNDPSVVRQVHRADADAWVVIAFGQKLSRDLLGDHFAINLHASLLPRWRGAAPINHAILAGDTDTGVSVITLADRMDAGLILASKTIPIAPGTTAGELHDALARLGPAVLERVLEDHRLGRLQPREQDPAAVTYAPRLSRADGWVDFRGHADACARRILAFNPWPTVTVRLGGDPLRLLRAQSVPGTHRAEPGTILDADRGDVACGEGTVLRLLQVQPAGRRAMSWQEFARGRTVPGTIECDVP